MGETVIDAMRAAFHATAEQVEYLKDLDLPEVVSGNGEFAAVAEITVTAS